jgi:hypothetical protein
VVVEPAEHLTHERWPLFDLAGEVAHGFERIGSAVFPSCAIARKANVAVPLTA